MRGEDGCVGGGGWKEGGGGRGEGGIVLCCDDDACWREGVHPLLFPGPTLLPFSFCFQNPSVILVKALGIPFICALNGVLATCECVEVACHTAQVRR
jgi:hypothetical protein